MSESGLPSLPPSEDSSFYLGISPNIEHIPVWSGPFLLFDLPHTSGPTLLHSSVTCSCLSPLYFWLFFAGTFFSSSCHSVSAGRAHLQINPTQFPLMKAAFLSTSLNHFLSHSPFLFSSQSSVFSGILLFACLTFVVVCETSQGTLSIGLTSVYPVTRIVPSTWSAINICGTDKPANSNCGDA